MSATGAVKAIPISHHDLAEKAGIAVRAGRLPTVDRCGLPTRQSPGGVPRTFDGSPLAEKVGSALQSVRSSRTHSAEPPPATRLWSHYPTTTGKNLP